MESLFLSIIILIICLIMYFTIHILSKKKYFYKIEKYSLICITVILFCAYTIMLFFMDNVYKNSITYNSGPYTKGFMILLILIKNLLFLTIPLGIVYPYFKVRSLKNYFSCIAPVSLILFSSFYTFILKISRDSINFGEFYSILYIIMIVCLAMETCFAINNQIQRFKNKDIEIKKELIHLAIFILIYIIPFSPGYTLHFFFNTFGQQTKDFNLTHRCLIYFSLLFPLVTYFICRNMDYDHRKSFLVICSLSGYFQYFFSRVITWYNFPLHLCNTAIILMFIAFAFHIEPIFYFTYLVNVLGAVLAMIIPSTNGVISDNWILHFWYNHIYDIALPVLGVALGIFKKTNIKVMFKAIGAFTIYILFAAFLNGYLNANNIAATDYFFLYSDFYTDKFSWAIPIKNNFQITIYLFNKPFHFFWLYQLTIYFIFIGFMFALWIVYTCLFKVSADHRELAKQKILDSYEFKKLKEELNGKELSDPIDDEGVNMIKFEHFSKIYSGSKNKAVNDFNLEIHSGEVFGFLGHNGAGKSTTIKSLVGIQPITEGKIIVEGYDVAKQPMEAKIQIGYVSDNHAVYEQLTGREYINYVADLYKVSEKDRIERMNKYLKMFDLEYAIDREIKSYSHGMKQKVMVISSLIHNPKVWVLDEPLTGLDPTSCMQIKECMREHANKGNIVFFSSHVIEVVEKICDRIAIISDGELKLVANVKEIESSGKSLEDIYMQYIHEHEQKKDIKIRS